MRRATSPAEPAFEVVVLPELSGSEAIVAGRLVLIGSQGSAALNESFALNRWRSAQAALRRLKK